MSYYVKYSFALFQKISWFWDYLYAYKMATGRFVNTIEFLCVK